MGFLRQYGALQRASQNALRRPAAVAGNGSAVCRIRSVTARSGRVPLSRSFQTVARPASSTILNPTIPRSPRQFSAEPVPRRTLALRQFNASPLQLRYCSHRRNMCRQFGAENEGSAMAVQQAREVLPTNVKPLHYDLTLEPDFDKATYEGSVTIEYATPYPYPYLVRSGLRVQSSQAVRDVRFQAGLLATCDCHVPSCHLCVFHTFRAVCTRTLTLTHCGPFLYFC